jgi:DNA repair protein RecO (recombination protein O)
MKSTEAILIRQSLLSETSLIVHWCSAEEGMFKTVAKGARRAKSVLAGQLSLFSTVELVYAPSRSSDLHTLTEARMRQERAMLMRDYTRQLVATYFIQWMEKVTERETPIPELHDLLRRALDYLDQKVPTRRAMVHFEQELAICLGLSDGGTTAAIHHLRANYDSPDETRQRVLSALQDGPTPAAEGE